MEKTTFYISGMRCGTCSTGIELALAKKNGIKSAKISYNEKIAIVEYDPVTYDGYYIRYHKDCESSRIYCDFKSWYVN